MEGLDRDAEAEGMSRRMLEDQVLVTVRSRAPRLRYDPGVIPYLYVNLSILSSPIGYAGSLVLEFARPVEVLGGVHRHFDVPSRRIWTVATVWSDGFTLRGSTGGAAAHTRRLLDRLLEGFLADYFRANP